MTIYTHRIAKKMTIPSASKDGELKLRHTTGRNPKWYSHFGNQFNNLLLR